MATKPHSSRKTAWHTNNMRGRRRNTARMQHPTSSLKSKNTHTNLPSYFFQSREMGLFDSLNWDVTGCVSSSTGNPLVSDTQWVCVCVRAYGGMRMWGRRHYITCCVYFPVCPAGVYTYVSSETGNRPSRNGSNVLLWLNTINTNKRTHATSSTEVGACIIICLSLLNPLYRNTFIPLFYFGT